MVVYNNVSYAYVKNLQGDVIAILDAEGNVVVSYVYDAWGMPIGKSGALAETLGTLNPFRYRGYVYDEESTKYYVTNRYYSPENSCWLNSDSRLGTVGKELHGNNMFAYCWNNPICMEDSNGDWPRWITAMVSVVAAAVTLFAAPATATTATIVREPLNK